MIYSPETKHDIKIDSFYMIFLSCKEKPAHSGRTDPSSSRLTCPVILFLAHVVLARAEH
jgi:hypothetical protein